MPAVNVREMNYGESRRNLMLQQRQQSSSLRSMNSSSSSSHTRKSSTSPKRRGMLIRQDSKVRFAQQDDVHETLSRTDLSQEEYKGAFYLPEEYQKMQKTAMLCVQKIASNNNVKVVDRQGRPALTKPRSLRRLPSLEDRQTMQLQHEQRQKLQKQRLQQRFQHPVDTKDFDKLEVPGTEHNSQPPLPTMTTRMTVSVRQQVPRQSMQDRSVSPLSTATLVPPAQLPKEQQQPQPRQPENPPEPLQPQQPPTPQAQPEPEPPIPEQEQRPLAQDDKPVVVRKRRINGRGLEAMIEEKRAELNHEPYVDPSKKAVQAVLEQQSHLIVDDPDEEEQLIAELYHKMTLSSVEAARERAKLDEKLATS